MGVETYLINSRCPAPESRPIQCLSTVFKLTPVESAYGADGKIPSPRLVMSKQSPRPVSKAVLVCVESPECESHHSAFSAFMTTQLSRDTFNLECCSKRTLRAIEWQRQCSMDLHQHISALLINNSAALFALSGYFSHSPYPYQPVCFSVRYT